MPDPVPTLIVDIGNTLIRRSKPGLLTRLLEVVDAPCGPVYPARRAVIAATVFTLPDRAACAACLRVAYPDLGDAIEAALHEDDGDPVVLPGARALLNAAVAAGWRVIAATNAVAGTAGLPAELAGSVSATAQSSDYGLLKDSPAFWTRLLAKERVVPEFALVVGDSESADRDAPRAAGLQNRLVRPGEKTLATLAEQITAAGILPADADALIAGDTETWGGRSVVTVPHLIGLVVRVIRCRRTFVVGDRAQRGFVVRRRSLPPAVVMESGRVPGVSWLQQRRRQRGDFVVPAGLREALMREGLSLDDLTTEDHRHAVAMIREARVPETASRRIADLVHFLQRRDGGE